MCKLILVHWKTREKGKGKREKNDKLILPVRGLKEKGKREKKATNECE